MTRPLKIVVLAALTILLAPAAHAQSSGVGRVFFSEQERRDLEIKAGSRDPEESEKTGASLLFNGVVRRSAGRATAWVNGAPLDLLPEDVRRRYQLRGEQLLVDDSYGRRSLSPGEVRQGTRAEGEANDQEATSRSDSQGG